MTDGFRVFRAFLTQQRSYDEIPFDHPDLGPDGIQGLMSAAVVDRVEAGGEVHESSSHFLRVDDARAGGWVIALTASGGGYGVERDVVDVVTGATKQPIGSGDAVLNRLMTLLVLPNFGCDGLLIAQTQGRSHLTSALLRDVNYALHERGFHLRLEANLTDEIAWNDYLNSDGVDVKEIQLVQHVPSPDRTSFGDGRVVRATLSLVLSDAGDTKKSVLGRMREAFTENKRPELTDLVGMTAAGDDDFDEQKIVYVKNKRERTIKVEQSWPAFIHEISSDKPLDLKTLLGECRDDAQAVLAELGVDRPSTWWPQAHKMKVLAVRDDEVSE
ncbi:MAG: hypothetical protein Q7T56_07340 [Nocardioidaceae bacterium]|nr:hypothetical protein [Nocardioidaceae bacterium]